MAKNVSTQWDFGDLFDQPSPKPAPVPVRKVLSVSELTGNLRRLLEKEFPLQWVTGEITNLRLQGSGHIYFTLKDANAQLSCVLFRGESHVDRSLLKDGAKINVRGELTVFEVRG